MTEKRRQQMREARLRWRAKNAKPPRVVCSCGKCKKCRQRAARARYYQRHKEQMRERSRLQRAARKPSTEEERALERRMDLIALQDAGVRAGRSKDAMADAADGG